jgi:hypothetical protein
MGPKTPTSTVVTLEESARMVTFRTPTLLARDDRLYTLPPTIPPLTHSPLHHCLQRHDLRRLSAVEGAKPAQAKLKPYPMSSFQIDIAKVHTTEGKLRLFMAIDQSSA